MTNETKLASDQGPANADPRFVGYYERESTNDNTIARARAVKLRVERLLKLYDGLKPRLSVADIGCGAGTQCKVWAQEGHDVVGLDISVPLIEIARKRARAEGLEVRFDVGSATALPYADESIDVCLLPELLEHVSDWAACLDEAVRVLGRGGVLYVSTTNVLCPIQEEYDLPLYSWYPGFLKRRYERLAVTSRPELVQYSSYPAVHWFSYARLRAYLEARGMTCHDRFELFEPDAERGVRTMLAEAIARSPALRAIAQFGVASTKVFAVKRAEHAPPRDTNRP